MLSSSTGTFLGTGTVLTQRDFIVQVRNPPRPPVKENEVTVTVDTETSTTEEVTNELVPGQIRRSRRGGWGRVIKRRRRRAAGQAKAKAMAKRRRKSKGKKGGKGKSWKKSGGRAVSYTHLTLPTNREV